MTQTKKVTYKEPKGYFNADMKKAANDFEKKAAKSGNEKTKNTGKKK